MDEPVPVYDVTVMGTENFKLAEGPFVHNSKDVADAMAGVAYGLTMRRDVWLQHGISMFEIPDPLKQMVVKNERKLQAADADGLRIANAG